MTSPSAATSTSSLPSTVSYFSRYALVAGLVRSFAATISMSLPCAAWTARQKFRPIRPNPLMPTRIVTVSSPHALRATRQVDPIERDPRHSGGGLYQSAFQQILVDTAFEVTAPALSGAG